MMKSDGHGVSMERNSSTLQFVSLLEEFLNELNITDRRFSLDMWGVILKNLQIETDRASTTVGFK